MDINKFAQLHDLILTEKAENADVIVWLQGDRYDRSRRVLELYNAGFSDKIIISGNNILIGISTRPGENNISLDEMYRWLAERGVPESAILIDENSMNTKEQAGNILSLAKEKGWKKIILIGSSYYQPRVFLTFLKACKKLGYVCKIINQPAFIRDDVVPEGRDKTAKDLIPEELMKLDKYADDIESTDTAFKYLLKNHENKHFS